MTTPEDRVVWESDEDALYRTGRYSGSSTVPTEELAASMQREAGTMYGPAIAIRAALASGGRTEPAPEAETADEKALLDEIDELTRGQERRTAELDRLREEAAGLEADCVSAYDRGRRSVEAGILALAEQWADGPFSAREVCVPRLRALLVPSPAATTGEDGGRPCNGCPERSGS